MIEKSIIVSHPNQNMQFLWTNISKFFSFHEETANTSVILTFFTPMTLVYCLFHFRYQ